MCGSFPPEPPPERVHSWVTQPDIRTCNWSRNSSHFVLPSKIRWPVPWTKVCWTVKIIYKKNRFKRGFMIFDPITGFLKPRNAVHPYSRRPCPVHRPTAGRPGTRSGCRADWRDPSAWEGQSRNGAKAQSGSCTPDVGFCCNVNKKETIKWTCGRGYWSLQVAAGNWLWMVTQVAVHRMTFFARY